MNAKHTPGPWIYDAQCIDPIIIATEDRETGLARVQSWSGTPSGEECIANARLIAAAPELLQALKGLLAYTLHIMEPGDNAETLAARAAIAKAEGRAE
jgi:hypothetical protein